MSYFEYMLVDESPFAVLPAAGIITKNGILMGILSIVIFGGIIIPVFAESTTFLIEGQITSITDPSNLLSGTIKQGDEWGAVYTFSNNTDIFDSDPQHGAYLFDDLSIQIGPLVYSSKPSTGFFDDVISIGSGVSWYQYSIHDRSIEQRSGPSLPDDARFSVKLFDKSDRELVSDSLLQNPPDPSEFELTLMQLSVGEFEAFSVEQISGENWIALLEKLIEIKPKQDGFVQIRGIVKSITKIQSITDKPLVDSTGIIGEKIPSPRKQMAKGIPAEDVVCRKNLQLMIRTNGKVICVREDSVTRLVDSGLALKIGAKLTADLEEKCTELIKAHFRIIDAHAKANNPIKGSSLYDTQDGNIMNLYHSGCGGVLSEEKLEELRLGFESHGNPSGVCIAIGGGWVPFTKECSKIFWREDCLFMGGKMGCVNECRDPSTRAGCFLQDCIPLCKVIIEK